MCAKVRKKLFSVIVKEEVISTIRSAVHYIITGEKLYYNQKERNMKILLIHYPFRNKQIELTGV